MEMEDRGDEGAERGLHVGSRPASRARCNRGPCMAAGRWGGAARRTGSLWKVHAPSPKGGTRWRPEDSPWRVAGNLHDHCK